MLIWGIGGGVATAAFEIAQALGARTIVTSSSDAKLERAREWGADVTVNHATGDVAAAVKEAGRRRRRGRARGRGDLEDARSQRCGGRPRGRLRRDEGPEPAGAAPPLLVEAADDPTARRWARARTSSAPTTSSAAAARACTSTASFRSRRSAPPTSGSRRASSSARSCCRSRADSRVTRRRLLRRPEEVRPYSLRARPQAGPSPRRPRGWRTGS